jgi:predicted O-methyltransferase YrrM
MNCFTAAKWLKYIMLSRHKYGHGIHSPFIFDLVTRIFRNNSGAGFVNTVEMIRREMLSDKSIITVNDLGSGRMKSNKRSVSEITRNSSVPAKYGVLLAGLAREFGLPVILEFGTSVGISTMYLAASSPTSKVFTVEGCEETAKIAEANFLKAGLGNITLIKSSFDEALRDHKDILTSPGMVFIDGNHRKQPMIDYFNILSETAGPDTLIVYDDIYYSAETAAAWEEIKGSQNVTFSIDIFRMGLLFFRKSAFHMNYIIRY